MKLKPACAPCPRFLSFVESYMNEKSSWCVKYHLISRTIDKINENLSEKNRLSEEKNGCPKTSSVLKRIKILNWTSWFNVWPVVEEAVAVVGAVVVGGVAVGERAVAVHRAPVVAVHGGGRHRGAEYNIQ